MNVINHFEPQDIENSTMLVEVVRFSQVDYHVHDGDIYDTAMRDPEVKMVNLVRASARSHQS